MGTEAQIRRVLLVDDDALFQETLALLLGSDPSIEVVGRASNGREALHLVDVLRPDVVTMDIDMPVMDGVEATRLIAERHPETCIVMVTASTSAERVHEAEAVGASGHVLKSNLFDELPAAIAAACSSGSILRAA